MIHQFAVILSKNDTKFERRFSTKAIKVGEIEKIIKENECIDSIFFDEGNIVKGVNISIKKYSDPDLYIFIMSDLDENSILPFYYMEMFMDMVKVGILDNVYISKKDGNENALTFNFDAVHKIIDSYIIDGKIMGTETDEILKAAGL